MLRLKALLLSCAIMLTACTTNQTEEIPALIEQPAAISEVELSNTAAPKAIEKFTDDMVVHFLDVGNADSIFIELPNGSTMLIDASESSEAQKIITYIYQQGYDSINHVVFTHPHSDHIGGAADVIENFNVNNVYISPATHTTKTYSKMLDAIEESKADVSIPLAGDVILEDRNLKIEVISPQSSEYDNLNNASIVLMITYGDIRFLFTGDIEKNAESIIAADIECDVLKVAHHGSSTSSSSDFLKKANPTYAVISVGIDNQYGHPTNAVLKRLDNIGAKIYRTDKQGAIVFTSDGNNISVNVGPSEVEKFVETTAYKRCKP